MKFEQEYWLIDLFHHWQEDPDPLYRGFETNFVTDVSERFQEEKTNMFISGRMMEIFRRIGADRYGMNWDQYKEAII